MTTNSLLIREAFRTPRHDTEDTLRFEPGVNVIVGRPQTGKTKWLQMLDYLFGERRKSPSNAFGTDLAKKYNSIHAIITIGDKEHSIERRWKARGERGKIYVDGDTILAEDFSQWILESLNLPVLRMPKGSPISSREWTEISWRELLRHIYRGENSWSGIAQDQPPSMQHACLMNFLGAAELLYSDELTRLTELRQQLAQAMSERDQFTIVLNQFYRHMVIDDRISVAPTADSVAQMIEADQTRLGDLRARRNSIMHEIVEGSESTTNLPKIEELTARWESLQTQRHDFKEQEAMSLERIRELEGHNVAIETELHRLARVRGAGSVLADLKVTHCPACDQSVNQENIDDGVCFLCKKSIDRNGESRRRSEQRIAFEEDQLRTEKEEILELLASLEINLEASRSQVGTVDEELRKIEADVEPFRRAVAVVIPPEVEQLDVEIGRLEERIDQRRRFALLLDQRESLARRVDEITSSVSRLQAEVAAKRVDLRLDAMGHDLSEGMNTYLNALNETGHHTLNETGHRRWSLQPVSAQISQASTRFKIGPDDWKVSTGGTTRLFFLMAYHFALLRLSSNPIYRCPNLAIVDVPPALDREDVRSQENFALEPFVALCASSEFAGTQVIAAGAAFEGLSGAHRIQFTKQWQEHQTVRQLGFDEYFAQSHSPHTPA